LSKLELHKKTTCSIQHGHTPPMTPTDFRLIVICPTISILTLYQSQSLDVLFHCSNVSLNFTYKHKFSTFYCQSQVCVSMLVFFFRTETSWTT